MKNIPIDRDCLRHPEMASLSTTTTRRGRVSADLEMSIVQSDGLRMLVNWQTGEALTLVVTDRVNARDLEDLPW